MELSNKILIGSDKTKWVRIKAVSSFKILSLATPLVTNSTVSNLTLI
jgi:hypothetical protein